MTDDATFGPRFRFGTHETLADGTVVYSVTVQHFAAVLPDEPHDSLCTGPGRPAGFTCSHPSHDAPRPDPVVREVGLVWESAPLGWCASPPAADWPEAVQRAERSFPDREGAAMFLYGFDAAMRWQRYQQALAQMPWRRTPETTEPAKG